MGIFDFLAGSSAHFQIIPCKGIIILQEGLGEALCNGSMQITVGAAGTPLGRNVSSNPAIHLAAIASCQACHVILALPPVRGSFSPASRVRL